MFQADGVTNAWVFNRENASSFFVFLIHLLALDNFSGNMLAESRENQRRYYSQRAVSKVESFR